MAILARRSFLGSLASLPLIGGSVALIGQPTAVAASVTPDLCEAYKTWLEHERRWLSWEMAGDPLLSSRYRPFDGADRFALCHSIDRIFSFQHMRDFSHGHDDDRPSSRAALVLAAVGAGSPQN